MAIVKMSKFSIALLKRYEAQLINHFNKFQYIHFQKAIESRDVENLESCFSSEEISHINSIVQRLEKTIEDLQLFAEKQKLGTKLDNALKEIDFDDLKRTAKDFNFENAISEVNLLSSLEQNEKEKLKKIQEEIALITPWTPIKHTSKDFTKLDYAYAGWGYISSKKMAKFKQKTSEFSQVHLEIITERTEKTYFYYISSKNQYELFKEILNEFQFTEVSFSDQVSPSQRVENLQNEQEKICDSLKRYKSEKKRLAEKHLLNLKIEYEYWKNKQICTLSKDKFIASDSTIFIEGYIPSEIQDQFIDIVKTVCSNQCYLIVKPAVEDDRNVPILLKNNSIVTPFEEIIKTYSLPRYNELDPTPLMMPFYSIFFGVMMGDLGYGLVMLFLSSLVLYKMKLKDGTKKFIKLFQVLSIPTIIAGLLFGSFFGGIIKFPALIDPGSSSIELIIVSLGFGLVNILFGLGLKAFIYLRKGDKLSALYDVGFWYLILIGAILFLLGPKIGVSSNLVSVAKYGMVTGIIGIILFSARENRNKKARLAWGLYNVYGITSYIGDLVSYTRIAALCLSGAFIGYAINLICAMLGGIGIIGKVASIVIFLVFQMFNMFLSGLSGYVHSMRLVYVEYFGKFYEGGGIPFQRFRAQEKFFKVK